MSDNAESTGGCCGCTIGLFLMMLVVALFILAFRFGWFVIKWAWNVEF